ncbi:MAG: pyridoxal phosphate-dependent aminotransferase [Deferribacterota bacterium]|nr:pyridoxal phosphate-dependent aminotransferase [Deferribacterota bacterium]
MRFDIAKSGNGLTYEIRNIVNIAKKLKESGIEIIWENIGDPVEKGEKIDDWVKEILKELIDDDKTYAYSPTQGVDETREFIADIVNKRGGAKITADDIIFFNGLGDAIARAYSSIRVDARIIMPEPTYSTHFLAEVLHASFPPNTYRMNPYNEWRPDILELERKVKSHTSIVGILVINPDNPTGFVYDRDLLLKIVEIAKKYDLFIISDEIYTNIVYNGYESVRLSDIVGDVAGLSMHGISKEFPWPGARCGWIQVYNAEKYPIFKRYIDAILNQKMAEVCSTTLPQLAIKRVINRPEYREMLEKRLRHYEKMSNIAYNILRDVPYTVVNRTNGSFYMSVVFNEAVLNNRQKLPLLKDSIKDYIEKLTDDRIENDKRFVYYLLGSTGICVVPLSSFFTSLQGFRITLLEKDLDRFEHIIKTLAEKIVEYIESSK